MTDHWDPTAAFLAGEYRPIGRYCPRCGRHDTSNEMSTRSQMVCGGCGASWQADALVVDGRPSNLGPDQPIPDVRIGEPGA